MAINGLFTLRHIRQARGLRSATGGRREWGESTMDEAQAKRAVADLAAAQPSFTSFVNRANTLIDNPDAVNQGSYGTCGMAAVLRSFLQHDRARFVQLARAVFEDTDFNGIATGPDGLLPGLLKKRAAKEAQMQQAGAQYKRKYDLDFILARSLGKLLKIRSPHMYEAQKHFSEKIVKLFNEKQPFLDVFTLDPQHIAALNAGTLDDDLKFELGIKDWMLGYVAGFEIHLPSTKIATQTPNNQWVLTFDSGGRTRTLRILATTAGPLQVALDVRGSEESFRNQGDLGLDSDGLQTLVSDVAGAPTATITKIDPTTPQTAVDAVNAQLAGNQPYAYALIRSFDDWGAASRHASTTFQKPPTPPTPVLGRSEPEGDHIVAINGTIRKQVNSYVVPVWTWRTAFEVQIPAAHLAGYLPIVVHGRIGN